MRQTKKSRGEQHNSPCRQAPRESKPPSQIRGRETPRKILPSPPKPSREATPLLIAARIRSASDLHELSRLSRGPPHPPQIEPLQASPKSRRRQLQHRISSSAHEPLALTLRVSDLVPTPAKQPPLRPATEMRSSNHRVPAALACPSAESRTSFAAADCPRHGKSTPSTKKINQKSQGIRR